MSSLSLGMKTSFSTNSSLYSTPCQSPGSLGSSLDSTHLSLQSKESLTTTGPSDNGGLLAIRIHQDSFNSNGRGGSRSGSCSSGSSLNSVRTLLPPSTTISSSLTWKPDQCNRNKSQDDPSKSINFSNNVCWQSLFQLRQDLTLKLSGLRQQVQLVAHQLNELEVEMSDRLNDMCQLMNCDIEGKLMNGTAEVNGTYLISPIGETRKSSPIPTELRLTQLNKLIKTPAIHKLPAMVKGYLTRRLMTTSKVKNLIKTIKDTTILLDNYRSEEQVAQEEIDFHRRLMIQLEKSLAEFHDVFFTQNKLEQMKLIARTREVAVEKVLRLSTEARRLQAEKARKYVHDKRKDSPLLTNTSRMAKQSRKDEPEQNQAENHEENREEKRGDKKENKTKEKPEEKPNDLDEEKSDEKQGPDVEMKPIEDSTEKIEPKSKLKAKTNAKTKPKAIAKPRKSAKSSKKISSSSEEAESTTNPTSTSPLLIPSESAAPTIPPKSSTIKTRETSEEYETAKNTKESAPKKTKRAAPTAKRVTRAAKKS